MAKATPDSITRSSDQLHRHYQRDYAGRSRHLCEVQPLERLIDKTRLLWRKAKKLSGARGREVEALVRDRLALYRNERDRVAEARMESPATHRARALEQLAQRVSGSYRRGFAGQDRRSRELSVLDRLIARLDAASAELKTILESERSLDISATKNKVDSLLEMMREERFAIDAAQADLPEDARKNLLAARANRLFDAYRVHFAGHARLTCQPERLAALVDALQDTHGAMVELADNDTDADNLAAVTAQLEDYRRELPLLRDAHTHPDRRQRIGQLGAAANSIFDLYRDHFAGRPRVDASPRLLGEMCERLDAILEQMSAIDEAGGDPANRKNLAIVSERLAAYEREYVEIGKAKAAAASDGDVGRMIRVEEDG